MKIYNSDVKSILMCGSECWKITAPNIKKCKAFPKRILRRILGVFWPNKISKRNTEDGRKHLNIRWRYIGHDLRKRNEEDQKVALIWTPEGKRKRGR